MDVKALIESVEKQFGKKAVMQMNTTSTPDERGKVVSTGCKELDEITGVGGYTLGKIVEVFGRDDAGCTTLALTAAWSFQRSSKVVAWIDMDHVFDVDYAKAIGVDTEKLLISQPDNGEQALEIIDMMARSGAVDLLVLDSTENLIPMDALSGDALPEGGEFRFRVMAKGIRKICGVLPKTDAMLMALSTLDSQGRTTGGNMMKFYASLRIQMDRLDAVDAEKFLGERRIKVVKNKMAPPFGECRVVIQDGKGIVKG